MRTSRSTMVITCLGAFAALGITGCVDDAGTGASTATLESLPLTSSNFVTIAPSTTTTIASTTITAANGVPSATVATTATGVTGATTVATTATNTGSTVPTAGEQSYTIVSGDYLSSIASRYGTTVQKIVDYNQWSDGTAHKLFPGDVVKIPPGASATGATSTTVAGGSSGATTAQGKTYTVVAGDFLSSIARKLGTTMQKIVDANGWTDGTAHGLFPGNVIKIPDDAKTPTDTSTTTTVAGASGATSTTLAAGTAGTYTIQAGDYLSAIATKTGTTVQGIVDVNGWTDGSNHLLIPGQQIKLPAKAG
jgi:LysM repeat protein